MKRTKRTTEKRERRKRRTRSRILGTAERPRLSIFRSHKHLYAQFIDDDRGHTIASASTKKMTKKSGTKTEQAEALGRLLTELTEKSGVKSAVFDRGSYKYHGRVKALAEAARKAGLKI